MYGYYWDPTYILVIIGALICMLASANVDASMRKYKRVRNARNMTGAEVAQRILEANGIYDVRVECLQSGALSGDHYDPRTKTVRLSYENYSYPSVTAAAVAAQGHWQARCLCDSHRHSHRTRPQHPWKGTERRASGT